MYMYMCRYYTIIFYIGNSFANFSDAKAISVVTKNDKFSANILTNMESIFRYKNIGTAFVDTRGWMFPHNVELMKNFCDKWSMRKIFRVICFVKAVSSL